MLLRPGTIGLRYLPDASVFFTGIVPQFFPRRPYRQRMANFVTIAAESLPSGPTALGRNLLLEPAQVLRSWQLNTYPIALGVARAQGETLCRLPCCPSGVMKRLFAQESFYLLRPIRKLEGRADLLCNCGPVTEFVPHIISSPVRFTRMMPPFKNSVRQGKSARTPHTPLPDRNAEMLLSGYKIPVRSKKNFIASTSKSRPCAQQRPHWEER